MLGIRQHLPRILVSSHAGSAARPSSLPRRRDDAPQSPPRALPSDLPDHARFSHSSWQDKGAGMTAVARHCARHPSREAAIENSKPSTSARAAAPSRALVTIRRGAAAGSAIMTLSPLTISSSPPGHARRLFKRRGGAARSFLSGYCYFSIHAGTDGPATRLWSALSRRAQVSRGHAGLNRPQCACKTALQPRLLRRNTQGKCAQCAVFAPLYPGTFVRSITPSRRHPPGDRCRSTSDRRDRHQRRQGPPPIEPRRADHHRSSRYRHHDGGQQHNGPGSRSGVREPPYGVRRAERRRIHHPRASGVRISSTSSRWPPQQAALSQDRDGLPDATETNQSSRPLRQESISSWPTSPASSRRACGRICATDAGLEVRVDAYDFIAAELIAKAPLRTANGRTAPGGGRSLADPLDR